MKAFAFKFDIKSD